MELNALTPHYSVAAQIDVSDLASIKAQGFEAIVCNRPDGEVDGQPSFASLKTAAEALGLIIHYIPMAGPVVTAEMIAQFKEVMKANQRVLGYCRTGNRSSILWNAIQQA